MAFYPILSHSLSLLLANPVKTVFATWHGLAMLVCTPVIVACVMPLTSAIPLPLIASIAGTVLIWLLIAAHILGLTCIVIGWHRYVLLDEPHGYTSLRPITKVFFAYAVNFVKLGLLLVCGLVLVKKAIGLVLALVFVSDIPQHAAITSDLIELTFMGWLTLRVAMGLPAAAIGERCTLRDSWRLTAGLSAHLVKIAFLIALISVTIDLVGEDVWDDAQRTFTPLKHMSTYIQTLFSASVLSTIYGVLLQARQLR